MIMGMVWLSKGDLFRKKDTARVEAIHRWSLRIMPVVSISLYCLLFISLVL